MMVFVGLCPNIHKEQDGMIQRIKKIDNQFKNIKRNYLEISYIHYRSSSVIYVDENIYVYRMNLFLHFLKIVQICLKADSIYIHLIGNALKVLFIFFFKKKVVVDMHGVVVEEEKMEGKLLKAFVHRIAENIVVKKASKLVVVTKVMGTYFQKKYDISNKNILVIPIFDDPKLREMKHKDREEKLNILYSGSAHVWQCVDLMLSVIEKTIDKFNWTILTGDIEKFKKKLQSMNLENKILLKCVKKEEIYDYYFNNDLGLVLREDSIINKVSCPTKLVEYMQNGIVPIVLNPEIGDFYNLKYTYIHVSDVLINNFNRDDLKYMAEKNKKIIEKVMIETHINLGKLQKFLLKE